MAVQAALQCATKEVKAGLAGMGPRMLVHSLVGPAFPPAMLRSMWRQGIRGLSENAKHRQRQGHLAALKGMLCMLAPCLPDLACLPGAG